MDEPRLSWTPFNQIGSDSGLKSNWSTPSDIISIHMYIKKTKKTKLDIKLFQKIHAICAHEQFFLKFKVAIRNYYFFVCFLLATRKCVHVKELDTLTLGKIMLHVVVAMLCF